MRPKALSGSIAKYSRGLALSVLTLIGASQAPGATYYWDSNGGTAGTGGTGTWDTVTSLWRDGSDTGTLGVWPNLTTDDAVFGGTAGTVTLNTNITANDLTFNTSGYLLTGSGSRTLTLSGTTPTISVGSGLTATINTSSATAANSVILGGTTGLTKTGDGTLFLRWSNAGAADNNTFVPHTFTGGVVVNGGTLRTEIVSSSTAKSNFINSANSLTLSRGTYSQNTGGDNWALTQTFSGLTLNGGANAIFLGVSGGSYDNDLSIGAITRSASLGGTITFNAQGTGSGGTVSRIGNTTGNTNVHGILGPWAFWESSTGTRYATNTGAVGSSPAPGSQFALAGLGGTSANNANEFTLATDNYGFTTTGTTILSTNRTANTVRYGTNSGNTIDTSGNTLTLNGILNSGIGALTISGTGSVVIGTTNQLVIHPSNSLTAISPIVISTPITGSAGALLVKAGPGNLTLSGANTYDGGTFLNDGTLTLGSTTALGTGTLTINRGSLDSSVANLANTTNNNVQNWNGDFTFVGTNSLNLGTGAVTMNASRTVGVNANTLTVGGAISGSGFGLTKTGTGTLALSGANTYDGATTINGGTLQVGNVTAGSLNGTTGTALTFGGTGSFIVSEASGVSQGMGALAFNAGSGNVTSTNNGGNSFLTFASLAARPVGVTGNFITSNGSNGTTNKIVLTDTTNAPLNNSGSNNQGFFFGGSEYARYDTTGGYFRETTYGTDTNALATVAGGADIGTVDATKDVKITGAITAQTAAVVNTINMGAFNITMSGVSPVLEANGLLASGGTNITLGGGTTPRLQPTSSGGEIVIRVAGSSDQLTVNSIIQNNTTASPLTKTGAGTLVLSGTNTYTGQTYVNDGTLTISNVANLGASPTTGGNVTVLTSATNSTVVTISSVPAGFVVGSTLLGSDVISIVGTTVTLYNKASEGISSSSIRSFFDNNNTLNLNGATLRTTANVGLFSGNTAAGVNNRSIVFSNGVTFNTDANTVLTVAGGITGTGGLTKSGLGTLTLTNGNTSAYNFTGGITVNGGTLSLSPTINGLNGKTNIVNTGNAVSLNNATLQWGAINNIETIDQTLNGVTISGPTVFNGQNNAAANGTNGQILRLSAIRRNAGATASFTLASTASIFTTTANTNGILGPWATIGTGSSTRYATGATTTGTSTTIAGLTGTTAADANAFASATANYEFTTVTVGTVGTTTLTGNRTANTARYSSTGNTIDLGASGSNTLTLNGLLNAGTGTLTIQRSGGTGTVVIGTTNELIVNAANAAVAISAPITGGSGTALIKTGPGTLTLSGDNTATYTGTTDLNAGVLALGNATTNTSGNTTAIGTGTLRINGGSLDSTVANLVNANNNVQTWNRHFAFVGTNSLNLGTGAVTITDNRTVAVTANTLTVGGIIGDGGSGFGLTKSGNGTLVLNGVNTFSGATSVIQGAIGGTGTIAGAVTVSSTGGINLLRDGAVGTLTLGSTLAITGASGANNLYFDLASAGSTTDKIAVTGAFSMTTSGAGVVNVNQLGGVGNRLTAGTYDIITAASGLSAANFQLATTKAFGQTFGLTSPDAQTLRLTTAQVTSATATAFWSGGGSPMNNWSTLGNWRTTVDGNVAVTGAPDYLTNVTFATTTPVAAQLPTNVLDVDFDINSLTFNSGLAAITIGGTTKTLTLEAAAGAGITSTQTTVTNTISAKVGLAASQTWSVAGTTAALGGLTVSGVISDFGAGYGLTKAGAGTLTLSGANTFTGVVSITGGILSVNSLANGDVASALGMSGGAASNLLLGNGTTLTYTGGGHSTDRSFTINGTAAGHGATLNASGSAAINFTNTASPAYGTANQTRTLTLTGSNTSTNTLAANIADNGTGAVSVAKTGAGTWVLSGNSSFTGGLTLSGGAVRVSTDANLGDASGPITVTSDSTLQIGVSAIATVASSRQINLNGGTLSFTFGFAGSTNSFSTYGKVTGSGNIQATVPTGQSFTLSLNSASNDFTGAVTIDAVSNGGVNTLLVNAASLADATGSGNIRFGRTNSLTVMTQQFTYTGTSDLTLNNRKIEFITGAAANSNSVLSSTLAAINVNTDLVVASGGNSKLTLDAPTGITSTFNGKLINGSLATLITKTGAGTWVLTGANTYTGATSITGGTLIARNGTAFGTTGTANVTVATQTGMSYYAATDVPLNIAGTLGITGGAATVIGGSIGSTTTSAQINVAGNATATAAAIKVNIYGNSFSTTTSGTNTYTLVKGNGGANTLSTATSLTLGTVYNNTNFTVGALSKTTSTIDVAITQQTALSGNVFWKGGLTGATGVWSASNGTTQSNWQVTDTVNQPLAPSSTSDLVFSTATSPGTMVGMALGSDVSVRTMTINNTATAFGLRADGYTLTLTPASSTDGIVVGSSVPASTIAANVALGASQTWTNNSVNSLTVSGRVSGGGNNLTTAGTGTIILSGANTYTGATTISAGTLQIGNGGTTGSLSPSSAITNDAALVFNRTDTITQGTHFASTISGTGTVTQAGTGTLVLSGSNSYGGVTNVNSGTLNIRNNDALGTTTNTITVASGAKLQLQNGITVPSAKSLTISQPGPVVFASGGTETSTGVYTVRTFTSNGALTVTSGSGGTVEYLVIGGGGGGGSATNTAGNAYGGGGGGAGGFLSGSTTITSSAAVTVGSFGAKGNFSQGFNGGNSILDVTGGTTVTAIGGGGGGAGFLGGVSAGRSGGSGGGGSGQSGIGGAGTLGQGNSGGNGAASKLAGGGGGAGAPGGNAPGTNSSGGNGGAGASSSITGITTFYAGGGGGGERDLSGQPSVGGIGGGGFNLGNGAGTDATFYGSGGGGGNNDTNGGNGFQGIAIVRYVGSAALENVSGNNTFSGAITLGSSIAIGSLQDTLTLGGAIGESGSGYGITKIGNGTLALSVANTYTGATSILQGTLEVTANNALGTNAAGTTVADGATLKLTGVNYSTTEGLIINGTGVGGGGALLNSGTSTFAGLITALTSATINAGGGVLNLTGGLVKDGTTLTFTGGGSINISSVISGASANSDLVVDATSVTLDAANTYNGPTTITNGGTLIANALDALPLSPRSAVSFTGTGTSALNLGANQFVASLSSAGAATVALGSSTLTVGIAGGNTTFAGSIGGTGGNLVKDTNSTQVLSGTNAYTGTTTVSGGTLEVQGTLSGTTGVTVNTGGTLLMNSAASDIVNTTATVAMAGGTLAFGNAANQTQNLGAMTLTANSILDFGAGGGNDKFHFASFVNTTGTLAITNWLGNDAGGTDGAHDRLVFTGLFTDFTSSFSQSQISFNGTSGYAAIDFGSTYEIVPVPEPATTALIGSIALCALIGYRERRRFTGLGKRTAARK
jgi:autotransporter-associated beta strand protein